MAVNDNKLSSFMGAFNGGLRPNKFEIIHGFPTGPGADSNVLSQFHCRAGSMPPSTMTTINVPYRGRIYKLPGIRTYAPWQMTILDDDDPHEFYSKYHRWSTLIKEHYYNTTKTNDMDFSDLMRDITVRQLDYNGNTFREATLRYAWPSNVGPLTLDMENNDTLLTFTVDFEYQWLDEPTDLTSSQTQSTTRLSGGGTTPVSGP